jgi:hypothetical protein
MEVARDPLEVGEGLPGELDGGDFWLQLDGGDFWLSGEKPAMGRGPVVPEWSVTAYASEWSSWRW